MSVDATGMRGYRNAEEREAARAKERREMATIISETDFDKACDQSMGWCTSCEDFTRECTEPDAQEYDCPECGENCVMGAEQALIEGRIEFEEDESI